MVVESSSIRVSYEKPGYVRLHGKFEIDHSCEWKVYVRWWSFMLIPPQRFLAARGSLCRLCVRVHPGTVGVQALQSPHLCQRSPVVGRTSKPQVAQNMGLPPTFVTPTFQGGSWHAISKKAPDTQFQRRLVTLNFQEGFRLIHKYTSHIAFTELLKRQEDSGEYLFLYNFSSTVGYARRGPFTRAIRMRFFVQKVYPSLHRTGF